MMDDIQEEGTPVAEDQQCAPEASVVSEETEASVDGQAE